MQEELAYPATTIALLNSALLLGYGVGQAINGNLADLYGARSMVTLARRLSGIGAPGPAPAFRHKEEAWRVRTLR